MGDGPVQWVPEDEFKKLEDYGRKKIEITDESEESGDYETTEESEEESGAMSFDPEVLNKEIDLELLDSKKYWTPQEVFDYFHSKSEDPDEKMTREFEEVEDIIEKVSKKIKKIG